MAGSRGFTRTNPQLSGWVQTCRRTHRYWTGTPDSRLYRRRHRYNTAALYRWSRRLSGLLIGTSVDGGWWWMGNQKI